MKKYLNMHLFTAALANLVIMTTLLLIGLKFMALSDAHPNYEAAPGVSLGLIGSLAFLVLAAYLGGLIARTCPRTTRADRVDVLLHDGTPVASVLEQLRDDLSAVRSVLDDMQDVALEQRAEADQADEEPADQQFTGEISLSIQEVLSLIDHGRVMLASGLTVALRPVSADFQPLTERSRVPDDAASVAAPAATLEEAHRGG